MEAAWRNDLYKLKRPLQESLARVDAALDEFHRMLDTLNQRLGDPVTYQDGVRVQQLQKEYQLCQKKIEALTEQWEASALALEELETNFWKDKEVSGASPVVE
jgi:ATP-binding cassette, subfamily F, member 3